ncbi:MAG: alpha/beta hydrolase [Syntrophobacteraceae bacterium]
MPVAKLDTFREDVRQFLKMSADIRTGMITDYVANNAPEIAAIWPKVVENNEKLFKGEVTIDDVWTVVARKEMLVLAAMLRHVFEQTGTMRMERNPLPQGVRIESVDADGVPAEWHIVPGASEEKVLLYFHGGGWILGSAYSYRPLTVALGNATEMRVLSVNYRLAPENPFPAGLEDCTKAYRWLLRQGFKPSNIIIAGDSAGGNLTLTTILKLRDNGIPLPKGAVCFSPGTDSGGISISHGETDPILADVGIFWWRVAYLGEENCGELQNPLVSPLFGNLQGFPPLLVQATPPEILFENARQFVERVKAAGGEATLQTWDGMVHVWQLFFFGVFPESREAIDKVGEWVKGL